MSIPPLKSTSNVYFLLNISVSLITVSLSFFFVLVIIILVFVFRSRFEGGDYETEEAIGAEFADDADTAVVLNQTGLPNMTTKFEYFM